jgi:Calcineurin-like phosphoesterase
MFLVSGIINMIKPFYSFNYQNVHFLAMATAKNSIIPYQNGSEQYNYVQDDLMYAHNNKSIDWIIVYSFRPFYSSVTSHSGQRELPDIYHRLFDEYGVDMVLQAHSHNYQRTFPLRYNESSYMPLFHPEIVNKEHILYINQTELYFLQKEQEEQNYTTSPERLLILQNSSRVMDF